jgi:tripartite-type tricarboxylate transporter receptor subunit TctC
MAAPRSQTTPIPKACFTNRPLTLLGKIAKRSARVGVVLCLLSVAGIGVAHAQTYPAKTVRMIVPIAPGGGTDTIGRLISQRLAEQMNTTIIVENRAGAGSVIGSEVVAKAPPDGYTLMTVAVEFTINPSLRKLPYDPIKDFTCIAQLTSGQYFLSTHPAVPVKTAKQFIALARSRPGQISFASSGPGRANHLAGVLFQQMTGTKLIHVPYKSSGQASIAVIGGEVDFIFSNVASVITQVRAGKVRAIATTGAARSPVAPDVPTLNESAVPGYVVTGFYLLMAPGATPPEIIAKLNSETAKAIASPQIRERLSGLGLEPGGGSPADCAKLVREDVARWAPVVKAGGATPD